LTARYFPNLLPPGTSEAESHDQLPKDLYDYSQPVGPIETMLVEEIAIDTACSGCLKLEILATSAPTTKDFSVS
jgi:hypothetical protein